MSDFDINEALRGRPTLQAPIIEGEELVTVSVALPVPIMNILEELAAYGTSFWGEPMTVEHVVVGCISRHLYTLYTSGWVPENGWGPDIQ